MTETDPASDRRRVARAASALGIPRSTARYLLNIPQPIRADFLVEVERVGVGSLLAFAATQPARATA